MKIGSVETNYEIGDFVYVKNRGAEERIKARGIPFTSKEEFAIVNAIGATAHSDEHNYIFYVVVLANGKYLTLVKGGDYVITEKVDFSEIKEEYGTYGVEYLKYLFKDYAGKKNV